MHRHPYPYSQITAHIPYQLTVLTLELESPTLQKKIVMNLQNPAEIAEFKKNPIMIKEGVEYKYVVLFLKNLASLAYSQLIVAAR